MIPQFQNAKYVLNCIDVCILNFFLNYTQQSFHASKGEKDIFKISASHAISIVHNKVGTNKKDFVWYV